MQAEFLLEPGQLGELRRVQRRLVPQPEGVDQTDEQLFLAVGKPRPVPYCRRERSARFDQHHVFGS